MSGREEFLVAVVVVQFILLAIAAASYFMSDRGRWWWYRTLVWRRPASSAEWATPANRPRTYFWIQPEGKRRRYETDFEAAVEGAHLAALAANEWPQGVVLWAEMEDGSALDVYRWCPNCEYCTWRDSASRCRPCYAAAQVSSSPVKAKEISRSWTKTYYPRWCQVELPQEARLDVATNPPAPETEADLFAMYAVDPPVCGFVPPTPGYAACTRSKGHDGPCAHERLEVDFDGIW